MEQHNIEPLKEVEIHELNQWFSNIVDTINFDLGKIEGAVPSLVNILTNIDTAPIAYLKDSLDELVKSLNKGFEQINDKFQSLDSRLKILESNDRNKAKGG